MLSTFSLSDNIMGFILDGPYDDIESDKLRAGINEKLEDFEMIRFYVEDSGNSEISFKTVLKDVLFKLRTANKFEKVAIVTDRKWLHAIIMLEKLFINADIRFFPTQQRLQAIHWISH